MLAPARVPCHDAGMATLSASAPSARDAIAAPRPRVLAAALASLATMLAIIGLVLPVMLTPWSTRLLIDVDGTPRTLLGTSADAAHELSDRTVRDLVLGGDFAFAGPDGRPMYTAAEIGHLRDVRTVLYGFLAVAGICALTLVLALVRASDRKSMWQAVARGGAILSVGVIALGLVGVTAFGPAFDLFHRILFPGGNWAFDPTTSRLVQLYPLGFWMAATAVLGVLSFTVGVATWALARRLGRREAAR
jgi:integral membrane protein (TIGR01906 family)